MGKHKRLYIVVGLLLIILFAVGVYIFVSKSYRSSTKDTKTNYTVKTSKELDTGKCNTSTTNELEKRYQDRIKSNDIATAGQVQYDLGMCATYNNQNDKALEYFKKAKELFTQSDKKLELSRVDSNIDFINNRLQRSNTELSDDENSDLRRSN